MKKLLFISKLVLVTGLSVSLFSCKENKTAQPENIPTRSVSDSTVIQGMLPIAFVNTDSLLLNYEFAKKEEERLKRKQEDSKLSLTQKYSLFEKDAIDFQQKLQKGVYSTQQRAQDEEARLMKKQQELKDLELRMGNELMSDQEKISKQLKDTLDLVLKIYNTDKKYQLILSNNAMVNTVLLAEDGYDITDDIIKLMNARYLKK